MSETSPHPEEANDNLPTPSFAGRLQLSKFIFTPEQKKTMPPQPLRKSPRLLTSTSSSSTPALLSPSPSRPSPSPRRKSPLKHTLSDEFPSELGNSPSKRKRPKPLPTPPGPLPLLPDAILPNLLLLFVGLNPGLLTSYTGHAYAHPTNLFWRLLHSSGITPRLCLPSEDRLLPALFSLGLTNIVPRPTRNGAELSKKEMDAGVAVLEEKIREFKPEVVCIVGKSIWESVWRVRHGRGIKKEEFRYGWQERGEDMGKVEDGKEGEWKGARVFVACSTSGLAATLKPKEKEEIWNELGEWVVKRRKEREEEEKGSGGGDIGGEVVDEGVKQEP
ncbi:putative G/U mismatch-specific uracil DNA glycosylase [Triangularia setosa]|uniref:G/U mismatch-specific uracil DNA glycosylase n=1 Tax=Triangularia setosa TaxID=2587417 RepID=A0AAN6W732_9PEZI|nr:putative G/U mismatch-specific uracil DNA glycosylase [Podospora setosa]